MEAVIVSSLIGLGMYLNKDNLYKNKRNFNDISGNMKNINLPSDPSNKTIYDSNFVNYANKIEQQKVIQNFNKAKNPIMTNKIPPFFNKKIFNENNLPSKYDNSLNQEAKNLNKPLKSNLTGTVIENFTHNNMVPFYYV